MNPDICADGLSTDNRAVAIAVASRRNEGARRCRAGTRLHDCARHAADDSGLYRELVAPITAFKTELSTCPTLEAQNHGSLSRHSPRATPNSRLTAVQWKLEVKPAIGTRRCRARSDISGWTDEPGRVDAKAHHIRRRRLHSGRKNKIGQANLQWGSLSSALPPYMLTAP